MTNPPLESSAGSVAPRPGPPAGPPPADREAVIEFNRDLTSEQRAIVERPPAPARGQVARAAPGPAHLRLRPEEPWCPPALADPLPWALDATPQPLVDVTWTGPRGWRSAGVSVRGARQAHAGMHREESIAVAGDADTLVLCLADGASSSRWARIAAEFVCRTVPHDVLREITGDPEASSEADAATLGRAVGRAIGLAGGRAWHGLRDLAAVSRSSPADFRTTLLLAVLSRARGRGYWFLNRVGDGMVLVRDRAGLLVPALPPANPDDRGDAGCRLPDAASAARAARIRVIPASEVESITLLSSGTEAIAAEPPRPGGREPADAVPALREWLIPVGASASDGDAADDEDRSALMAWRGVTGIADGASR